MSLRSTSQKTEVARLGRELRQGMRERQNATSEKFPEMNAADASVGLVIHDYKVMR
jgi:hypothetical protein